MYSLLLAASLFVMPALAAVDAKQAIGTIDNTKVAESITSEALTVPDGKYYMQNVATGEFMHYDNSNGRQLFPADESQKTAIDFWKDELEGVSYSRLSITDGRTFCPSAQWWYRENGLDELPGDFLAPLYDCSIGPGTSGGVRDAKQQWFVVDASTDIDLSFGVTAASGNEVKVAAGVDADVSTSSDDNARKAPEEDPKPSKAPEEDTEAEEAAKETPKKVHKEVAKPKTTTTASEEPTRAVKEFVKEPTSTVRMTKCHRKRTVKRDLVLLERMVQPLARYQRVRRHTALHKRASSYTVYIVTADHKDDMQSRCLHGVVGTPREGDTKAARLEPCDKGTLQQWILTPAE